MPDSHPAHFARRCALAGAAGLASIAMALSAAGTALAQAPRADTGATPAPAAAPVRAQKAAPGTVSGSSVYDALGIGGQIDTTGNPPTGQPIANGSYVTGGYADEQFTVGLSGTSKLYDHVEAAGTSR
ncbi:MAG: hypothetical protein LBM66_01115, partial [Bifidobacteriaceae bacterium]|nr:hypothetical protein [Bifidobacteriaceae bacterium]